jgi:inorganic pyrophosphatase
MTKRREPLWQLMGLLFRAHPWHGVPLGGGAPNVLTAYIEIVPSDTVKYELDKNSGLLKVDRPQQFSNVCPSHYGLIPQTYCGEHVAERMTLRTGRGGIIGDGDPLDICVLTEKVISHGDILLRAIPIGGLSMIDGNEADDKILAVMEGDASYGAWQDIDDCPPALIERLRHYFLTYKNVPHEQPAKVEITELYGRDEALAVIEASHQDYLARFSDIEGLLTAALRG